MNPNLEMYVPLVEFIAQVVGSNCEVLLHDFSDLDHSIVAMSQTQLTGREIGGTVTDFALTILHNKEYQKNNYLINYSGQSQDGAKHFRSSTFFIKNKENPSEIYGMLCINVDTTALERAKSVLDDLVATRSISELMEKENEDLPKESYTPSIKSLLGGILGKIAATYDVPAERLNPAEKEMFVGALIRQGFFLLKGGVTEAANWLGVSEQSIYRYMKAYNNQHGVENGSLEV